MSRIRAMFAAIAAWFRVEAHRHYLYRVGVGIGGVFVAYGLVSSDRLSAVIALLGVLLASSNELAAQNTRRR